MSEEMEAGPELDRLIAEEVMGWTKLRQRRAGEWCGVPPDSEAVYPVSFYSDDMGAAWAVVEKMVSDGEVFIVKGDGLRDGNFSPRWTVMCGNLPRTDSDNLPLVICRAALAAVRAHRRPS